MLSYKQIIKIFANHEKTDKNILDNNLTNFIKLNWETNKELWNLEDSARMHNLGANHVARAKKNIDQVNQVRNDLIRKIDIEITKQMNVKPLNISFYYSESPGMIIDRLSILYIKFLRIKNLKLLIKEKELKREYEKKETIVFNQFNKLSTFLDLYFKKIRKKRIFFEIQEPVKIYNDKRIKKYIK